MFFHKILCYNPELVWMKIHQKADFRNSTQMKLSLRLLVLRKRYFKLCTCKPCRMEFEENNRPVRLSNCVPNKGFKNFATELKQLKQLTTSATGQCRETKGSPSVICTVKWFCSCEINIASFPCRSLQNNNVKLPGKFGVISGESKGGPQSSV